MLAAKLLIHTTTYDDFVLDKRFRLMEDCHNILVRRCIKLLGMLKRSKEYQSLLKEYHRLQTSKASKSELRAVGNAMNEYRNSIGLSQGALEKYISVWQKQHRNHLSSMQCQKEVSRVMDGVDKVLFGNGKKLHFCKRGRLHTICGKNATNGIKFHPDTLMVSFLGLEIKCRIPKAKDVYKLQVLSMIKPDQSNVSYYEISREPFKDGYHYYLDIYLKEDPIIRHKTGENTAGIDPGTSTVAYVSDDMVLLDNLAPLAGGYDAEIKVLRQKLERSRRVNNPQNYNPDGTVKKGCKKWVRTKNYMRILFQLRELSRKKAAYTKQSHEILANTIAEDSIYIFTEQMHYQGLAKRAAKTERSGKASDVKQKDGTVKQVRKYRRKKRWGKSIANRAPALFLSVLKRKVTRAGGFLMELPPGTLKASQYDHSTGAYTKSSLSERTKTIDGRAVQRDLYSAFLIRNVASDLESVSREKCKETFDNFVRLQNERLAYMKQNGISNRACFGF